MDSFGVTVGNKSACGDERRRRDTRQAALFGLDFVEVELTGTQATLQVFFLGKAPPDIVKANVRIAGGRRVRDIRVKFIHVQREDDPTLDDYLEIGVDRVGDASVYTLGLVQLDEKGHPTDLPMAGFDPCYAAVDFTFRAGCPSTLDCKIPSVCPPPARELPEINYLAKDYESFRQLIFDRLALTMPNWRETHAPDLAVALIEVLAYVGDYLSYYQDTVATEAYLATARQRISVGRHACVVDYHMHEGCNARAWIALTAENYLELDPDKFFFIAGVASEQTRVLQPQEYAKLPAGHYEIFKPLVRDFSKRIPIIPAHSEIAFYTWGDCACCLPIGATSATLTDQWIPREPEITGESGAVITATAVDDDAPEGMQRALQLKVGDILIFEEIIGPRTGNPSDADPKHRQAVRLTKVTLALDPLYHPNESDSDQPVVEIEWCTEDALTFPLCISAQMPAPDCDCCGNLSVARGNVILVDNGRGVDETLGTVAESTRIDICATDCTPPDALIIPSKFQPVLSQRPLTFAQPLSSGTCAAESIRQDPRRALPCIELTGTQHGPNGVITTRWSAQRDLINSNGDDWHFVVEIDDDGYAHLRFGDGHFGRMPEAGTEFQASYRIGNGPSGNVGAEKIRCIVFSEIQSGLGKLEPRNPLPAGGGFVQESVDEVKLFAPTAFRNELERAITADDYATIAADNARRLAQRAAWLDAAITSAEIILPPHTQPHDARAGTDEEIGEHAGSSATSCPSPFQSLQGAKSSLRWNGSWYEALIAVDPLQGDNTNNTDVSDALLDEIAAYLEPYRRVGHDVDLRRADYVPLDLALSICVRPTYLRAHVESALLDVFSNRVLADGRRGFFHPDNLSFGDDIYISRIVATAQAVDGVTDVRVTRLERFNPGEPLTEPDARDLPPDGVLALGAFEIARLDNDPSVPDNGRLTLTLRGGR